MNGAEGSTIVGTEVFAISTIKIDLPDQSVLAELDSRAKRHGRSIAEEAGDVLSKALANPRSDNMTARLRARFDPLGGAELLLPPRAAVRDPPFTFGFGFDDGEADEDSPSA